MEYQTISRTDAWRIVSGLGRFTRDVDGDMAERADAIRGTIRNALEAFEGEVSIPMTDSHRNVIRGGLAHASLKASEDGREATARGYNKTSKDL